nr:zona pellucida C [Gallus gallus]AAV35183.1 zona pellucida C [Gallus gallus]AAV35185.1 zona pellucida C [Gallus gallus]AAV35186.1 zona pellucida C [Gallus gallus]AAV35190.1 zona pellucida C [Gallus gallus]|eukprot:NP_989720.3 zona pellucida sperm-binding protein 3 [Gallus gallus]
MLGELAAGGMQGGRVVLGLLCCLVAGVGSYTPWDISWAARGDPSAWSWGAEAHSRAVAGSHPVAVQCQEAQLVVTVHRDLFGTGRLINAADLTLGPAACKHSSLNAAHNTVTFAAGLHECGSVVQVTPDTLIYRTLINYDPSPASNPVIIRTNPAVIPIECHYPRRENVSSNAIRPTWSPFNSALSAEERLVFSLRLMSDDWSTERPFTGFQLGDILNIQAEVSTENHVPLRLFVDSCVAALSPDGDSSPHYAIIDFNGCLVDGRVDDTSSAFITPRPREDVLRFRIDVFRFAGDNRNLIYITCHLKVTPADQGPDPQNKACSFNKARNTWVPVEGSRDVCNCCETGNCEPPALSRRLNPMERWQSRRFRRDAGKEVAADVVIGPVLLSADPGAVGQQEEGGDGAAVMVPSVGTGLVCVAVAVALAAVGVAVGIARKGCTRTSAAV